MIFEFAEFSSALSMCERCEKRAGTFCSVTGDSCTSFRSCPLGLWSIKPGERISGGPGTELKHIIESTRLSNQYCASCRQLAREMDRLGSAGCIASRKKLINILSKKAKSVSWRNKLQAVMSGYVSIGQLVDEAIQRAAAKGY